MASGVLETIERLLNDADMKFMDKLRSCRNQSAGPFTVVADRSFSLRQQVAHNAALMSDTHFVEMLEEIELCQSPEYMVKNEMDRKLSSFLAGLLKGVLREVVGTASFSARKVQLEMAWHWFQDKRKLILDFAMDLLRPAMRHDGVEADGTTERRLMSDASTTSAVSAPSKASVAGAAKLSRITDATKPTAPAPTVPSSCPKLKFADEARQKSELAATAKKLELFKTRDLSKSAALRDEIRQLTASMYKTDAVKVVYTKRVQEQRQQNQAEDQFTVKVSGCAGPSPYIHIPGTEGPRFDPPSSLARPPVVPAAQHEAAALASASQRIVSHLVQRVEEEHDQREMNDAHYLQSFQEARLEEETNRRIESDTYGAQAGRTCHPVLRRATRQPGDAGPVSSRSLLPSARVEPSEALAMLGKIIAPAAGTEESLSAYDHYLPGPLDEDRLQTLLTRIKSCDDNDAISAARKRKGLSTSHPTAVAGNSAAPLDIVLNESTVRAPTAPRSDVPLADQLHVVLDQEAAVPSVRRLEQLKLVDRIRDCFARATTKGGQPIHVPRSVVERSILLPDDRPYEECIKLLPRPGSAFLPNPFVGGDGKTKKKKKAASPKKSVR